MDETHETESQDVSVEIMWPIKVTTKPSLYVLFLPHRHPERCHKQRNRKQKQHTREENEMSDYFKLQQCRKAVCSLQLLELHVLWPFTAPLLVACQSSEDYTRGKPPAPASLHRPICPPPPPSWLHIYREWHLWVSSSITRTAYRHNSFHILSFSVLFFGTFLYHPGHNWRHSTSSHVTWAAALMLCFPVNDLPLLRTASQQDCGHCILSLCHTPVVKHPRAFLHWEETARGEQAGARTGRWSQDAVFGTGSRRQARPGRLRVAESGNPDLEPRLARSTSHLGRSDDDGNATHGGKHQRHINKVGKFFCHVCTSAVLTFCQYLSEMYEVIGIFGAFRKNAKHEWYPANCQSPWCPPAGLSPSRLCWAEMSKRSVKNVDLRFCEIYGDTLTHLETWLPNGITILVCLPRNHVCRKLFEQFSAALVLWSLLSQTRTKILPVFVPRISIACRHRLARARFMFALLEATGLRERKA